MKDQGAVPLVVVTRQQELLEALNSTLRNAGHPVHCTWIRKPDDLGDALLQVNPELIVLFAPAIDQHVEQLMEIRDRTAPEIPVLIAMNEVDEASIARAMSLGAQDVISLKHRNRLQAVVARELRAHRLERALDSTLSSAREYKQQLRAFLDGSADAIAHVQEGIIVDTNRAWLELFGYGEDAGLVGQPLMDLFAVESHTAMKGALVACGQGRWQGPTLKATAMSSDGSELPLELALQQTEYEGEPCVRVSIAAADETKAEPERQLDQVISSDPITGLYHRRHLLEQLRRRLAVKARGGLRALVYIRPDQFSRINQDVGPLASEDVLSQFADLLRAEAQPSDIYGRFGGTMFLALIERGTERDIVAWGEHVLKRVARQTFDTSGKSLSMTASMGAVVVDTGEVDLAELIREAEASARKARKDGGHRFVIAEDMTLTQTRTQAADQIWVRYIKAALMENRFKLVQQPIATLAGDTQGMYDVLIRMVDEQGSEVLPSDFIPAAERNNLMKNIDRWVIGAAMSLTAARKPSCLFVRLAQESVTDGSLLAWLGTQLKAARIEPSRICFQVTEEVANQHIRHTRDLVEQLRKIGFGFAIEHFGTGSAPLQLLSMLPMNYLKIDGSLMQGLSSNDSQQQQVAEYVEAARAAGIQTIAERVEDANTMAVLWQLGVGFMQGYYVHEPEVVLSDDDSGTQRRRVARK